MMALATVLTTLVNPGHCHLVKYCRSYRLAQVTFVRFLSTVNSNYHNLISVKCQLHMYNLLHVIMGSE